MKSNRFKCLTRSLLAFAAIASPTFAVDEVFQNDGSFSANDTPPQVDAKQFINNGTMSMSIISAPFETRNTTSFINRGTIQVSPGIRFETITHDSVRTPADSFFAPAGSRIEVTSAQLLQGFNFSQAQLLALEQQGIDLTNLILPVDQNPFQNYQAATLSISARNIDIRGRLQTDVGSSVEISGDTVSLQNASIYGAPPPGSQSRAMDIQPDGTIDYVVPPIGLSPTYGLPFDAGIDYGSLVSPTKDIITIQTLSGPLKITNNTASATSANFPYRDQGTQLRAVADDRLPRKTFDLSLSKAHYYYIVTNALSPTNQTIRAAFVGASDPDVLVDLIYGRGGSLRLLLGTTITNVADGGVDLIALSLDSQFPTDPRLGFAPTEKNPNDVWPLEVSVRRYAARSIPIARKDVATGNVTNILSRSNLLAVMRALTRSGSPSTNSPFRPDLFTMAYVPTNLSPKPLMFTNMGGTNPYIAFGFKFDSAPSHTELLNTSTKFFLTNNLGRVGVVAKSLDMSRTRIKSQGPVVIQAEDLLSTQGSAVEAPYVSLNLGSKSGDLKVQGLIRPTYETLSGNVDFFSMTWTNTADFADPASTNTPPDVISAEVDFQYTVANVNVTKTQVTRLHDLVLKSTKVSMEDSGTVEGLVASVTEDFNINGRLTFLNTLTADSSILPSLKRLKIGSGGLLDVPSLISLGVPNQLESVSVDGQMASAGVRLNSKSINIGAGGLLQTRGGSLNISADSLTISNSATAASGIVAKGPSQLTVGDLNLNQGSISVTNSALRLNIANAFRVPAGSGGAISVPNGLEFPTRPAVVDLSGLTIRAEVPAYADATFLWPGVDVGAVVAGFSGPGNMAIKSLAIGGDNYSTISFAGPDTKNALYVQQIQLLPGVALISTNVTITTDRNGAKTTNAAVVINVSYVAELMQIPDTFTVYFGSAINESGVDVSDALDRAIPGRLRLVKVPTAPAGLVEYRLASGLNMLVPRSVIESTTIDSDGDGIVNRWDPSPFDGVRLSVEPVEVAQESMVKITFTAGTGGTYQVEASNNLGEWKTVETVENTSDELKRIELLDRTNGPQGARNYRVRYAF